VLEPLVAGAAAVEVEDDGVLAAAVLGVVAVGVVAVGVVAVVVAGTLACEYALAGALLALEVLPLLEELPQPVTATRQATTAAVMSHDAECSFARSAD
jgi:hypothetical protein